MFARFQQSVGPSCGYYLCCCSVWCIDGHHLNDHRLVLQVKELDAERLRTLQEQQLDLQCVLSIVG